MSEEQPGQGPLWEGLGHEEPMGPVAVPESGAEGGGRGLARLLARRASASRRGRGLQRAACSLTLHAVSAPGTPDTGPARAPPDSVPRPPASLALSPTTRVGQGQHRREVSCQEGPRCHAKAHLHGAGAGSGEGQACPLRVLGTHIPLLGPGPLWLGGFRHSGPGAWGRCRMGLVLAGPGQGCAGCGIPLIAAGPVCGVASGGLLTGRGHTLAGPRPEAVFKAEACGILLSAARTSTTPGTLLAVAWPGVSHGARAGVPLPSSARCQSLGPALCAVGEGQAGAGAWPGRATLG